MSRTLFFLVKFGAVLGEIVFAPSNTAVTAGERMSMNCPKQINKWTFYNFSRATSTIYRHESSDRLSENFRHFGVTINANGPVTIYANTTRSSDAGIYKCHGEIDGKDVEYSAHLIVLDSLIVCESNLPKSYSYSLIDGDYIWIQCSISFRGFWAPSMAWILHGGDFVPGGKNVTEGIETMPNSSHIVISKLTIAVNSSTNGSYYSCKIYFDNHSNTEVTTANNVPNFTYTWNSSAIYASSTQSTFVTSDVLPTEESSSVDWYLAFLSIVAGVSLLVILLIALAIARFIRLKKTVSVPRIESATDNSKQITQGSSVPASPSHDARNSRPLKYFGGDGTEYMEVNAIDRQPIPARLPVQTNMFNVVGEYACIDHTLSPPIPPRGKNA